MGQLTGVKDDPPRHAPDADDLNRVWLTARAIDIEAFLALPREKRMLAVARVKALQELTTRATAPTRAEQEAAAAALGISLPRLQALMRAWRRQRSLSVVVPYLGRKPPPRSTLPAHKIARRVIEKALAEHPYIAEPSVSRRIAAICERLGHKPPARMTVRSLLEDARRALPSPTYAEPIDAPGPEVATYRAGERLVLIDQYFEAAILSPDGHMVPASARLLIDWRTGFLLGATQRPDLRSLGRNAVRTLEGFYHGVGPWHLPQILSMASDLPPEEEGSLRKRCGALGIKFEFALRRHTRRFSDSVLWPGFERLRRAPEPVRRTGPAADWPRLSDEELEYLLEHAVDAQRYGVAERRLDDDPRLTHDGEEEFAAVLKQLFEVEEED
ncbi:MAG TPA: hypothetical protein VF688_11325 [Allosphingosinicella sp.]